jgi:hypothetical protein
VAVEIKSLTLPVATYVAANARDEELKEHAALFEHDLYVTIAALAQCPTVTGFAAFRDGNPEFVFGTVFDSSMPHIAQIWGVGTRNAARVLPAVTRFIRTCMIPSLKALGLRRAEVRVMQENQLSIHWLTQRLGGTYETDLKNFGRNGETFVLISWINDDVFCETGPDPTAGPDTATADHRGSAQEDR